MTGRSTAAIWRSGNGSEAKAVQAFAQQLEGQLKETGTARDALEKLDHCLEGESGEGYLYYQLRYVDGLKPREIAAATGQPIGEVYRLRGVLARALRRCAERLGLAR